MKSALARRGDCSAIPALGLIAGAVCLFKVNEGRLNIADEIVKPQSRSRDQHAARPRVVLRRSDGAPRRDAARRAVHHDADGRRRRRQRDPRAAPAGARRPRAAGLLRRNYDRAGLTPAKILHSAVSFSRRHGEHEGHEGLLAEDLRELRVLRDFVIDRCPGFCTRRGRAHCRGRARRRVARRFRLRPFRS